MTTLPLEAWTVEQLRATVFALSMEPAQVGDWWNLAAGSAPSEATANLKTRSAAASGSAGPGQLVVNIQPDRVDWLAAPEETTASPHVMKTIPSLGGPAEVIDWFVPLIEKWLGGANLHDVTRIAFGGVFLHPEENNISAYGRLPAYVPVRIRPGASDFMYQINHPVVSGVVQGLRVNTLTRWSVALMKLWTMPVTASGPTIIEELYAMRAEFDVNTAPASEVPDDKLVPVFRELVALAKDSIEHGVAQ